MAAHDGNGEAWRSREGGRYVLTAGSRVPCAARFAILPGMTSRKNIDTDRIDEAVLALLWLNLSATGMAWKGFDWNAMDRLHERGLISDPVGKARSVEMTPEGRREAERLFRELFARS